jgi:hypothetical protein
MATITPINKPINPPTAKVTAPLLELLTKERPIATPNKFNKKLKPTPTKAPIKIAVQEICFKKQQ